MLRRKIEPQIEEFLSHPSDMMLLVEGARQTGKSYIIRHVGERLYPNFVEVNMEEDRLGDRIFAEAKTKEAFYFALSAVAGEKLGDKSDTLVFIDEIQAYDHLLTLVKFLKEDDRFTYVASGSLLGVALRRTPSIPVGFLEILHMYPLDFEEFLWANSVGELAIAEMKKCFDTKQSLPEAMHRKVMDLMLRYLLVGGMPAAVNSYVQEHNIVKVRKVQADIMSLYKSDAVKYENDLRRKLQIKRIYEMIPSNMENRRKRMMINQIEGKKGKRTSDYQEEFEYLVAAGIALEVKAISQPTYPLIQNSGKNLLKLYLNDVGLLTSILYETNIMPVLEDIRSINLGAVYETLTAQELAAHGFGLYYYDNKKYGEVDFLIDDVEHLTSLPIEVKSGKDYAVHTSLTRFLDTPDYNVHRAFVLSNHREISEKDGITYLPIYCLMFITKQDFSQISTDRKGFNF